MGTAINNQAIDAMEKKAREFMAQRRFRKARDEFKALCKLDRARYLPDLIQANIGLAKEMMASGLTADAEQVIAYLKTIATPEQLRSITIELAVKQSGSESNAVEFIRLLQDASASLSEADKIRLADRLIVDFKDTIPDDPEVMALFAEARAIQEALRAVSLGQWSQAAEALRPLSHGSCLGHWKLYVKGLSAFYQGEVEKAVGALSRLPADSLPAKASQPLLLFAGKIAAVPGAGIGVPEALATRFCLLMGHPALGRPLAQADQWWQNQDPLKAYTTLRKAIPEFPSDELNELGVLSDFSFSAATIAPPKKYGEWVDFLFDTLDDESTKNVAEKRRVLRAISLTSLSLGHPQNTRDDMDDFLRLHQSCFGPNPRMEAQACYWLSNVTTGKLDSDPDFRESRRNLPNADFVVEVLKRGLQCDPENLDISLKLCRVYEIFGQKSVRNRLIDQMTRQFPEEKSVLLLAGRECVERKAFPKGIAYLERAHELDGIDPAIKDALVEGRQRFSQQLFKERKSEKARQTLALNKPLLVDQPTSLLRSRWAHGVVEGIFETIWGDRNAAAVVLEEARQASPSVEAFLFHAHLAHRFASVMMQSSFQLKRSNTPFVKELLDIKNKVQAKTIGVLLDLYHFWNDQDGMVLLGERFWLMDGIKAAQKHPFTRQEVLDLVYRPDPKHNFASALAVLLKKLRKSDPHDPEVNLAKFTLIPPQNLTADIRFKLEDIILVATERKDHKTLQKAQQLLEKLKADETRRAPESFGSDGPDDFADDFEDSDPFDQQSGLPNDLMDALPSVASSMVDMFLESLPAKDRKSFKKFFDGLSSLPDKELEMLRQSPPPGMSQAMADLIIIAAKGKRDGTAPLPPQTKLPPIPIPIPGGNASSNPPKPPDRPLPPRPIPRPKRSNRDMDDPNQLPMF